MKAVLNGLKQVFKAYVGLISLLPGLITKLSSFLKGLLKAIKRKFRRPDRGGCCLNIPPGLHTRPDPMIYDQYWLMSQGLAVTWDNPDIQLYDMSSNPVQPWELNPDQDYQVIVRIWNNAYTAPAPGLPVYLSFLSFGVGVTSTPIGSTSTNLGVKGSAACPAFANFLWHTPSTPGHYCLQALLVWPDDANPFNNLGQKNTQVGTAASPAQISFPVQNAANVRRHFELQADMYAIPPLLSCSQWPPPARTGGRLAESRARWDAALRTQSYGNFPVTAAWNVTITPTTFDLDPNQSVLIDLSIEPSSGGFHGTQAFNIHAFASPSGTLKLVGGITFYVEVP